jgi:predicted nuclease of predicted toxin-antitoxin system
MKLLADEGVDASIVGSLRSKGHEVLYIAELRPGITDEEVLSLANEEGAVLVTTDKDFGELVYRMRRIHAGVLLLRLEGLSGEEKGSLVVEVLGRHGDGVKKSFTVVSPTLTRIRQTS